MLLSTNSNPLNATEICYVSSLTGHDTWGTYATQQSAAISLVAGQSYYIEALMKQATSTDNLSVAWMPPGGTSLPAMGSTLTVTGITYSGTTATATLSAAPGFVVGQSVLVSGASQSAYNGTFAVTAVSGSTFSYTMASTPTAASTACTVQPYGISYSGTTAYVWLPNHGYASGSSIDIAGATPAAYNGLHVIANVTTNTFTYTMTSSPAAMATGTILVNKILPIPGTYLVPYGGSNVDLTTPTAPANLRAAVTGSNNQITLNWAPVPDPTSGIDHYAIYRDGSPYATSTTTTYTDASGISPSSRHTYVVAAVNYDGVQGASSLAVSVSAVGIASITTSVSTSLLVTFTEPVDATSSQLAGNYQLSGGATVSSAVLESNGCSVVLTTSALTSGNYTLTVSNVKNIALSSLPVMTGTFAYSPLQTPTTLPGPGYYAPFGPNGTWNYYEAVTTATTWTAAEANAQARRSRARREIWPRSAVPRRSRS